MSVSSVSLSFLPAVSHSAHLPPSKNEQARGDPAADITGQTWATTPDVGAELDSSGGATSVLSHLSRTVVLR